MKLQTLVLIGVGVAAHLLNATAMFVKTNAKKCTVESIRRLLQTNQGSITWCGQPGQNSHKLEVKLQEMQMPLASAHRVTGKLENPDCDYVVVEILSKRDGSIAFEVFAPRFSSEEI